MDVSNTLVVLLGATGVGKTELSLDLARRLGASIVSADSRQIYRELPIGTAAPTAQEQTQIVHYLVGTKSVVEPYSASLYEEEVMSLLPQLFAASPYVVLSGGSMMYIDALCKGIDQIPDVDPDVRDMVYARYAVEGLEGILHELRELDPVYYARVDRRNYKRVLHGLEVCLSTGRPFSSYHLGRKQVRPFRIVKVGLHRERGELYDRIDRRVVQMMELGLEGEARGMLPYRSLNALNTVGYKELFRYFDGDISLEEAVRQIQRNSRIYARKQLTWWRKDREIVWFAPHEREAIYQFVTSSR